MDAVIEPVTVEWMGTRYKILLTNDKTRNIGMFESLDQPGYGPPRHIHHQEDEAFYLLSGEVEFWLAGRRSLHGPGEVVFVPRGVEHTFQIVGNLPARMLTVMTPGGFEGFFAEVSRAQLSIPNDMSAITEIGSRFHLTFTGPPLAMH
jgi:quercetin dioxygenase-like cupin family protein